MSDKRKKTRLKPQDLTSVDLCPRGANPESNICLFKSDDGAGAAPPKADDNLLPHEETFLQRLIKSLKETFTPFTDGESAVEKGANTFAAITARQEVDDNLWKYIRAFEESVRSIASDDDLDTTAKSNMMNETLGQFSEKMKSFFPALLGISETPGEVGKSITKGDVVDMEFDTSKLTPEEKATFEALAKKCKVKKAAPDVAGNTDNIEHTGVTATHTEPTIEKSDESNPVVAKALEEIATLKKSYEQMIEEQAKAHELEIAKKYTNLGKKPDELADTLYNLKKSGEENYNAYIAALDANLDIVNKSGMFAEIGKNTHGTSQEGGAYAKAEAIAKGYMKDDPSLTYNAAMTKAWESNPDLIAEYEAE